MAQGIAWGFPLLLEVLHAFLARSGFQQRVAPSNTKLRAAYALLEQK